MRVLVPRRMIGLGILMSLLCLSPILASPTPVFAKPLPWVNIGPPDPTPTPGDGDGTVVKAPPMGQSSNPAAALGSARTSYGSRYWNFLRLWLLGYSLRWYR